MANAALSLTPASATEAPGRVLTPTADGACAACGVLALAWMVGSAWPGLGLAAWPAASLGLVTLALALSPGRVIPKALGTICGFLALVGGCLEIAALWSVAWVLG